MNDNKTSYLLIAHGEVASSMLNALEFISGKQPNFCAIALDHALDVDKAREMVLSTIKETMGENGLIVLTDLFGGSPSNIALSMPDEIEIEIVAGVNMPMLLAAINVDNSLSITEKAAELRDYARDNIFVASEVLSGKKKKK